ncbi:PAS domain S-box protein [Oceanobacillus limi]|nr:PAS domain S-box protein [Oceanobacillus limi]
MKKFLNKIATDMHAFISMFDSIEDLVFLLHADGDSFRYEYVNKTGLKILGYPDKIIGKKIEEVVTPARASKLIKKYREAVVTKETIYFEEKIQGYNDAFVMGETSLNPIVTEDGICEHILAIVRDVTDRKQNELELKSIQKRLEKNQKRMESLVRHNQDAVFELDKEGNFVSINEAGVQIIGYRKDEIIGTSSFQLIHENDLRNVLDMFSNALTGKTGFYETWIRHKNGTLILVDVKNIPITVDGEVEGIYGIAADITKKREMETEMERIKNELQLVWDNTSDGIFLLSQEGELLSTNPRFEKMLGYRNDELKSHSASIIPEDDITGDESFLDMLRESNDIINLEVKRYTKGGSVLDVLASYRPINKGDILAVGMYKDITDRVMMQKQLEESEQRYRKIVELSPEAIIIFREGVMEYINKTGVELLGVRKSEGDRNEAIFDYIHVEDHQLFKDFISKVESRPDEDLSIQLRLIRNHGETIYTEVTAAPVDHHGKKAVQAIFRNITDRVKQEEQLTFMAFHDPLTGLMNRRAFNEAIEEAIKDAKQKDQLIAVLYMDMDNFKDINDTLGHDVGDKLLKQFANRLKQNVRGEDVLCRVGGDEFLVLLKNITDRDYIVEISDRIYDAMQEKYLIKGNELQVTSSFGIALYPEDGLTARRLIHHADVALYTAKEQRNNYAFFSK